MRRIAEGVKKLLHNASNQKEETAITKNVVSIPRFLDMSLKDLLDFGSGTMVPFVELYERVRMFRCQEWRMDSRRACPLD